MANIGVNISKFGSFENLCEIVATHNLKLPDSPMRSFTFKYQDKEYRATRLPLTGKYVFESKKLNVEAGSKGVEWLHNEPSISLGNEFNRYLQNFFANTSHLETAIVE